MIYLCYENGKKEGLIMIRLFKVFLLALLAMAICLGSIDVPMFQAYAETEQVNSGLLVTNEVNNPVLAYESAKLSVAAYKEEDIEKYYLEELGFDNILSSVYSRKESASKSEAAAGSVEDYVYYMLAKKDIEDENGEITGNFRSGRRNCFREREH